LRGRSDDDDDDKSSDDQSTQTRRALRALLLCQRVYFSELWAQIHGNGGAARPQSYLSSNWKADSLRHWNNQPIDEIHKGITTFCVTRTDAPSVAKAAEAGPPDPQAPIPDLTLTRDRQRFPGTPSGCYQSVMGWLFKSGLVSYRWYMKHQIANNKASLRAAFGEGREIWSADQPFSLRGHVFLPRVPRGHIVHLYAPGNRWLGHWLVSLGGGRACGCNNDTEAGAVERRYSSSCSLDKQFYFGYKQPLPHDPSRLERGIADVFDPFLIPNRL
jgi:hypothetical protein